MVGPIRSVMAGASTTDPATLLFLGAGISQAAAIEQLRMRGHRVVAVDGEPDARGLAEADIAVVHDLLDVEGVTELGRRHGVEGVMTVAADRAVPVVAAVAERLQLPGIGLATARVMRNKCAMRRRLAERGVPQPPFSCAATADDAVAAAADIGLPVVLKPADSGGQRGLALVRTIEEVRTAFENAVAFSPSSQAIVEEFLPGLELNGIVVAREGRPLVLTLSDRLRPPGRGFGVGWAHVYPASASTSALAEATRVAEAAVRACGLRDGIAFPQLLVGEDGSVRLVEIAARIPAGQMADLVLHAVGVDLVDIAVLQALGRPVPDDLVRPRFEQPLAIKFLTAQPGPLPVGRVTAVGPLDVPLAQPGVVQVGCYIEVGEEIKPVELDIDRRGYVIAAGGTGEEALRLAEQAALTVPVAVAKDAPV